MKFWECGLCFFLVLPISRWILNYFFLLIWVLNQELITYYLDVSGLLGTVAPCVLYGSNVERLAAGQGTFANSCLPYTGLYMLGNSLFGWNCLAPWFSHPTRTAIRRRYNLEASVSVCPDSVWFSICQCVYPSPFEICL